MVDPYQKLLIKKYQYWTVYLHPDQTLKGKTYLWCHRDISDLLETNQEEKKELFIILEDLKKALNKLFQPDKYNYLSLGNETNHLHIHLEPRYKADPLFGKRYQPTNKEFEEQLLIEIRDQIKEKLSLPQN